MTEHAFTCPGCGELFEISIDFETPPIMRSAELYAIDASKDVNRDPQPYWKNCAAPDEGPAPLALTEQHIAGLERAIRAAGFYILHDLATGEFELSRVAPADPDDDRNTYDGSAMR